MVTTPSAETTVGYTDRLLSFQIFLISRDKLLLLLLLLLILLLLKDLKLLQRDYGR